jgi:DNA modification methylase
VSVDIRLGDCRVALAALPTESVHCVVTSPPYFGLRDYQVAGQIGLESTLAEFIAEMVSVFREVRRVLRGDGTCWLNMGDSYAGSWGAQSRRVTGSDDPSWHASQIKNHPKRASNTGSIRDKGLKSKDLMMVPARLAIALCDDGWWLRKDIIWAKPNPMPESATDRPTSSHEHMFLLTKAERYFYDADAVREARTSEEDANTFRGDCYIGGIIDNARTGKRKVSGNKLVKVPGGWDQGDGSHGTIHRDGRTEATYQAAEIKAGRNMRDVWTIASAPFPDAHFATFPPKLVEPCILAGTSAHGCCSTCGAPWSRVVAKGEPDLAHQRASGGDAAGDYRGTSTKDHAAAGVQDASAVKARILAGMVEKRTTRWQPTCSCQIAPAVPCVVLDPFGGAGTTGLVADRLGRDAVLIELNPEYAAMARARITRDAPLFAQAAE